LSILPETPPRRDVWAGTRWSIVSNLDRCETPGWQDSWEYLVKSYREPMERYVRRAMSRLTARSVPAEEAAEAVQSFLATCVEKNWLSQATPQRGRFRAYLQDLLRKHAIGILRHDSRQKRSPGKKPVPVDEARIPAPEEQVELDEFSRSWVQIAIDRTLERLREEHEDSHTVVADLIATEGKGSQNLDAQLGLNRTQLYALRTRARKRFCRIFEDVLAETVDDEEAFGEEWRWIRAFLPAGV